MAEKLKKKIRVMSYIFHVQSLYELYQFYFILSFSFYRRSSWWVGLSLLYSLTKQEAQKVRLGEFTCPLQENRVRGRAKIQSQSFLNLSPIVLSRPCRLCTPLFHL